MRAPTIEVRGLRKSFGEQEVLRGIDINFEAGEFIGLMGANGAGKSTLIKILGGVYPRTSGDILLDGKAVASLADHPGVAFIHQDLGLIEDLSISDNLRLGEPPLRPVGTLLNRKEELLAAEQTLALVGLDISPMVLVKALSSGEKALVAIAKAFARGASILFVDESTSTLPPAETKKVIRALSESASSGATIIMVTHKLAEILDATNRVLVILEGQIAVDRPTSDLDREALVKLLVQHDTLLVDEQGAAAHQLGPAKLEFIEACTNRIGPITFSLRGGEIVGISGLPGSGLHDVAFLAQGVLRPTEGRVVGAEPNLKRAMVPPHRESQGGFDDMPISENMTISSLHRWRTRIGLLSPKREGSAAADLGIELGIRPAGVGVQYGVLSGGNKQKVVFARALMKEADVFILCEPTRGVDISTRADIYSLIRRLRGSGVAVLVVSSDAEDLFSICDRIGIVSQGRIGALKAVAELTEEDLEMLV